MTDLIIETRDFAGKRLETDALIDSLPSLAQAGLRQFSLERMIGYGLDYADAIELRARIIDGADWKEAAVALADGLIGLITPASPAPTRAGILLRASAVLRMGQMMMIENSPERSALFCHAAGLYEQARQQQRCRHQVVGNRLAG